MDITVKKLKQDSRNLRIVKERRNKLILDGKIPQAYTLPLSVQLELTSKCNLKCKHCYNRSGEINRDRVGPNDWINICKKLIYNGGVFQATMSGGEPLLLGNSLWEIMDILHNDNTIFNLISNGLIFDRNVLEKCKKYRFYWIQISIDSYREDNHDKFRGVKGSWKAAATAAYNIALSGIPLRIATTINPNDLENIEDYIKMAINLGASYYIIGEVMPSGRAFDNKELFLSLDDRNKFYEETDRLIKKYQNKITIYVSGSQKTQLEYAASNVIEGVILRPDGAIRLDCTCPFIIGNFLDDDFISIWNSKTYCWQDQRIKEYINSCDPISGFSSFINNYNEPDILL